MLVHRFTMQVHRVLCGACEGGEINSRYLPNMSQKFLCNTRPIAINVLTSSCPVSYLSYLTLRGLHTDVFAVRFIRPPLATRQTLLIHTTLQQGYLSKKVT